MKLLTYNDMEIEVLLLTPKPTELLARLCSKTTGKFVQPSRQLVKSLIHMNHGSLLEHIVFRVDVKNVSRSFLAQITRHRIGSFTSSSQHYQDYRDYPMIMHPKYANEFEESAYINVDGHSERSYSTLETLVHEYITLMDGNDVPREEARQILPNASAVTLTWTVNFRSLVNFFNLRCCNRNTAEMHLFANRLLNMIENLWPDCDNLCGPDCFTSSCRQLKMRCNQRTWLRVYNL